MAGWVVKEFYIWASNPLTFFSFTPSWSILQWRRIHIIDPVLLHSRFSRQETKLSFYHCHAQVLKGSQSSTIAILFNWGHKRHYLPVQWTI
jgi:hypothetical protein